MQAAWLTAALALLLGASWATFSHAFTYPTLEYSEPREGPVTGGKGLDSLLPPKLALARGRRRLCLCARGHRAGAVANRGSITPQRAVGWPRR